MVTAEQARWVGNGVKIGELAEVASTLSNQH